MYARGFQLPPNSVFRLSPPSSQKTSQRNESHCDRNALGLFRFKLCPIVNRDLCTGASGVLGTAVYDAFINAPTNNEVLGLAYTRPKGSLKVIDLLDTEKVEELVKGFKPDCESSPDEFVRLWAKLG